MYSAIYRDFRPDRFDQIIGQDHIVKILKNQIAAGQTGHAYLFCGTRGTGKTTTARILAKALNCESDGERPCCVCENCKAIQEGSFIDVIEIDAASNSGVDNIRDLRESVKYPPVRGRNKVYIIDEVHVLSPNAENALLKTLEEPPEHVVFILATTEPQRLLPTILSRCIRLNFRRVSEDALIENMEMICGVRGVNADRAALALIAANADGSVRDSLSILEQCISTGEDRISRDDVAELLGAAGEESLITLTGYIMDGNVSEALIFLDQMIRSGSDIKQLMKEWLVHFRNLLMAKYVRNPENVLNMSTENVERVRAQAAAITTELLNRSITDLTKTISDAKWSMQPRLLLEMCVVRLGAGSQPEMEPVFRFDGASVQSAAGTSAAAKSTKNVRTGAAGIAENIRSAELAVGASAATESAENVRTGAVGIAENIGNAELAAGAFAAAESAENVATGKAGDFENMWNPAQNTGHDAEEMIQIPPWQSDEEAGIYPQMPMQEIKEHTDKAGDMAGEQNTGAEAADSVKSAADQAMWNTENVRNTGISAGGEPQMQTQPPAYGSALADGMEADDLQSQSDAQADECDVEELWKTAVKKAVGEKPMLIRIETKAHPVRISNDDFYVTVDDDYTEKVLMEKGKTLIESKLEMYYGSHLSLRIDNGAAAMGKMPRSEDVQQDAGPSAEELALQIGQRFHMKVDLE